MSERLMIAGILVLAGAFLELGVPRLRTFLLRHRNKQLQKERPVTTEAPAASPPVEQMPTTDPRPVAVEGPLATDGAVAVPFELESLMARGEFAFRRGAIIEAFYWTLLAVLQGADDLEEELDDLKEQWLAEGCPDEFENVYDEFTEEQGAFARIVLELECEIDSDIALVELEKLSRTGLAEARDYLKSRVSVV